MKPRFNYCVGTGGRGRWGWNYRAGPEARGSRRNTNCTNVYERNVLLYADATLSVFNGRREIVLLKPNNCTTHKLIREVESDRNLNCSG